MATDKRISELPLATTPLAGTEEQEIIQGGVNKRVAVSNVGGSGAAASETTAGIAELATQAETNTGTDDARIVTPLKAATRYAPGSVPAATTGVAVAFAVPQIYATPAAPETGNITLTATGLIVGTVQVLYHNNATAPTFGAEFVRLSGFYVTSTLNIIYMHAISASRIEYMIFQEL